jgi:hypothetical protein
MLAPRTLNGLLDIAAIPSESIPASARAMARLSLYDWFTVTRAGENEPVAKIVRGFVADEGGKQAASPQMAESAPTEVRSGRTGIRAIAVAPLGARILFATRTARSDPTPNAPSPPRRSPASPCVGASPSRHSRTPRGFAVGIPSAASLIA